MTRRFALALGLGLAAPAAIAQTSSLDQAWAAGQIGERYDGYVGVAGNVSSAVRSQVASMNIQRRALYSNLAASKRVSPQDVGIIAGCQLLARVQVGHSYLLQDGQWRRRQAGETAPRPDYCR